MSVTGTSWFRRNITSRWTLNQGSIQTSEPRADRAATLWLHISDTDISREKHDVGLKLDLSRSRCCMTEHRSTVKDVIFAFCFPTKCEPKNLIFEIFYRHFARKFCDDLPKSSTLPRVRCCSSIREKLQIVQNKRRHIYAELLHGTLCMIRMAVHKVTTRT